MKAQSRLLLPMAAPSSAEVHVAQRMTTRWLAVLTGLLVVTWLLGGVLLYQHGLSGMFGRGPTVAANGSAHKPGKTAEPHEGPWGHLEVVPISISPPLELVPEYVPVSSHEVVWRFPDTSSSQLSALLMELGLPEELRSKLLSLAQLDAAINGFTIRPSRELVLGLGAESRAALYVALGTTPLNADQMKAFRFCGDSLDEWFEHATLCARTKQLVAPLVYRHGGYLFFADLRSIEDSLPSPHERLNLIKALSRESTFVLRLKVDADSDIDELVNYWGRGGRAKDVRPLIESLANVEGGQIVPVSLLLPPFARRRIYTYPTPPEKGPAVNRDCHWTSFNFFSEEPDDRFCDEAEVVRTLDRDYYRVYGNLQLGDLVFYVADGSKAIHSAVFLADDFVFSKNGNLSTRPWMLMRLEDMKNFYPSRKPLEVRYYRRKDL